LAGIVFECHLNQTRSLVYVLSLISALTANFALH